GPFIDRSHPKVILGEVDQDPDEIFQEIFAKNLGELLDISPHTLVLLLPSVRDIISHHAVFPQAELDTDLLQETNIKMIPNPSRFSINGVSFAVTSVDVLWHLKKEEFLKSAEEVDCSSTGGDISTTARYCRHLLSQRR
ncbi:DNA polymerase alpha/epsilon, subunit B, partial [Amylostereum chailletii]